MKPDRRTRSLYPALVSLAAASVLPLGAARLDAQTTDNWKGGQGDWSDGTLWSTGAAPDGATYDVSILDATPGTTPDTASNVALDGNYTVGRLTLGNSNGYEAISTDGNVTPNQTLTIIGGAFAGSGTFLNDGNVYAGSDGGTLTIVLAGGAATFTNKGGVSASANGGGLTIQLAGAGTTFINNGNLDASNGSAAVVTGSGRASNPGVFSVEGGPAAGSNSSLSVAPGLLTNLSNGTLTGGRYSLVGGVGVGPGSFAGAATLNLGGNVTTNAADIALNGPGATITGLNALATNQGSIDLGGSHLTTNGALTNSGSFYVEGGGTLHVNGTLTQAAGAQLGGLNGTFTAASFVLSGGVGPHIMHAFFAAGATATNDTGATMAFQGNVTFNPDAALFFELDLKTPALGDRLTIGGNLTLDGRLDAGGFAGFGPGRYDLIDYTGSLTDDGLDLGKLPAGYNYRIDTSIAGQVDLVVTVAPEPSTWAAALLGGGLVAWALRRRAYDY